AKICDLGSAEALPAGGNGLLFAQTGTSGWAAPEVFAGGGYGTPADVFSLGIVVWEAFAGAAAENPLCGLAGECYAEAIEGGLLPPVPCSAPPAAARIMRDCWLLHPSERPAAAEVALRLAA
ncbi:unnamed protein product, partial [Phaeothamnion confervicola]